MRNNRTVADEIAYGVATRDGQMRRLPRWQASFSDRLVELHESGAIDLHGMTRTTIVAIANKSYRGESGIHASNPTPSTLAAVARSRAHLRRIMHEEDQSEHAIGIRPREDGEISSIDIHSDLTRQIA